MSVNFVIQMSVPRYEVTMHEAALVYSCMHGHQNSKFDVCIILLFSINFVIGMSVSCKVAYIEVTCMYAAACTVDVHIILLMSVHIRNIQ